MKTNRLLVAVLLVLGTVMFIVQTASAQTRLGLHVTQEELEIWRQRAASGPYRTNNDVSTNSPGDWTRIQNNANSFLSNPSAENWSGQTSDSCWVNGSGPKPSRSHGDRIRDAGFVYLVTGNTTYRDAVLARLLAQAGTAGTDFTNTTRWVNIVGCASGDATSWEITNWLTRLLFAYDYIRHSISAGDRTTLDTWFANAGLFWENNTDDTVAKRFPGRLADDYTLAGGWSSCSGSFSPRVLYFGGPQRCSFHEGWSNRQGSHFRFFALAGLLTNNATLKARAKRWFEEWIKYTVYADGTHQEFHRWISSQPTLGWAYAATSIGEMAMVADAYARAGDRSLYDFTTSDGVQTLTYAGTSTQGGPKSLHQVITIWLRHVDTTVTRYGTDQSANNGNPNYRIDTIDELAGLQRNGDHYITMANVFYNDPYIKSVYMRTASGAPAYPSSPSSGGYCPWCGPWGVLPGPLFMFGQMEGKVRPYPESGVGPKSPSDLAVSIPQ